MEDQRLSKNKPWVLINDDLLWKDERQDALS